MSDKTVVSGGIGLGSILAGVLSWMVNHSIFWVIVHGGFCGWLYVFYALIVHSDKIP